MRRGDHIVVGSVDRLARSFLEFAQILDTWIKRGVIIHVLDQGYVLDPSTSHARALARLVVSFADSESRMAAQRTRKALAETKAAGRRHTRIAPFGYKWQRRGKQTIMVAVEREQEIMHQVAKLRFEGYSIDEIRQYAAYEWQVRNRNGRDFGHKEIAKMALGGAKLMRAEEAGKG